MTPHLFLAGHLALLLGATPAVPALQALPHAHAEALKQIESDPLPKHLTQGLHFVVSDERHHFHFRKDIENLGGVFIGIGTNQNFAMASWARPDLLILVDFDQMIIDVHNAYRAAFLHAPDPRAFVDLWTKENKKTFEQAIATTWTDKGERRSALRGYRYARRRVLRRLREVRRIYAKADQSSYLSSQEDYDYLVSLYKANRVISVRGDLTLNGALQKLAALLHQQKRTVRTLYLSNTESYFSWGEAFRTNMRAMPTDERSVVLRTRDWRPKMADGSKGAVFYAYHTQSYALFRRWLDKPKVRGVRNMLPWKSRVDGPYPLVEEPPTTKP